jgi:hypothetical protein
MVDSIRPFTTLIRALSRKKADAASSTPETPTAGSDTRLHDPAGPRHHSNLESVLRSKLAAIGTLDSERARLTFVETILLFQLGEQLARDPAFSDVVTTVADQLQADEQVRGQLTKLIASLRT